MKSGTAIIRPVKTARTPALGPVAIMVSPVGLLAHFRQYLDLADDPGYPLYHSRLYYAANRPGSVALAGPMMGAPYAVAILETLVAWGARTVVFAGWCGAISNTVRIGDLLVPGTALSGEGTSRYYAEHKKNLFASAPGLAEPLIELLSEEAVIHKGTVWSTDAIFRETGEIITGLQQQGVLAIEMELSALFAAARFHHIDLAGVLAVSDHLGDLTWQPGFTQPHFKAINRHVARTVSKWAAEYAGTGTPQPQ